MLSKESRKEAEGQHYPVFVASDISIAPQATIDFYQKLRDACKSAGYNAFLPIDAVGSRENQEISDQATLQRVFANLSLAKLGVFYVGFNSTDVGMMLARAKQLQLPHILLYEAEKEGWLQLHEPKIWWRLKERHEPPGSSSPLQHITPTSYASLGLIPESRDQGILAEIKFTMQEEACSVLEKEVKKFFHDHGE